MKCSEIIKILETLSPRSMACDWDNPGLLAGRSGKEVKTIFLAVDATDSVIEQAEQAGADMILTHHPLIFKGIKQVSDQNFIGRRVLRMIFPTMRCTRISTQRRAAWQIWRQRSWD